MSTGDTEEWFKERQFRKDVAKYLKRHQITRYDHVAVLTDLTSVSVKGFLTGGGLTVRTMAALANLCDLDLNAYVLTQSQHDDYMDHLYRRQPNVQESSEQPGQVGESGGGSQADRIDLSAP